MPRAVSVPSRSSATSVDGPIPAGRDDDVDAVADGLTDDRAGGRLIGGLVDLGRDPVAFEDLAEVGDAATRPEGGRQTGGWVPDDQRPSAWLTVGDVAPSDAVMAVSLVPRAFQLRYSLVRASR